MTRTDASPTTIILAEPPETSEAPATRAYRLAKSFAAVHFEHAAKGRIVFLPAGAELRVIGSSCLCGCFEIMFENQLYNMFKVDLLGPWSTPVRRASVKPASIKPNPIKPIRALAAVGACA
jgi:hypothetical protein